MTTLQKESIQAQIEKFEELKVQMMVRKEYFKTEIKKINKVLATLRQCQEAN